MTPMPRIPRSTLQKHNIPVSNVASFVCELQKRVNSLHSFMLLHDGEVVAEAWWRPYRPEAPHELFSLSKSFTSTAIGLAIAEGRLSVHDSILKFFPEQAPKKVSPNLAEMQVHHLLSMSTGHDQDTTPRIMRRPDPLKAFLDLPVEHHPGTHFVYNSGASFMLAALVQKLTGQTLHDYLTPRLFSPLGIEGATWESHPNGVNFGGWGLSLKTEDIARFGQLYLQKGAWNDQQLIPAVWVEAATSKQVSNPGNPNSDWSQGYGYQFWHCQHNAYRGDGAFGQYCLVMPEQNAVLAMTGGLPDMQIVLSLVWEHLLPALRGDREPVPGQTHLDIDSILTELAIPMPQGSAYSPLAASYSNRRFAFDPNELTLHSLSLDFAANTFTYRLLDGGQRRGRHTLSFDMDQWVDGITTLDPERPKKVAARGTWTADDTFLLAICPYETPFTLNLAFHFAGNQLKVVHAVNYSFEPSQPITLVGKLEAAG